MPDSLEASEGFEPTSRSNNALAKQLLPAEQLFYILPSKPDACMNLQKLCKCPDGSEFRQKPSLFKAKQPDDRHLPKHNLLNELEPLETSCMSCRNGQ